MKIFQVAIFLASMLVIAPTTHSAQIELTGLDPNLVSVEFTGEIQPADFEELRRLIEPRLSTTNSFRWFKLNSRGGDVATAMKIGRYIRELQFETHVQDDAQCLSSCVFILAAGLYKLTSASNIGIHRPFSASVDSVSREVATRNYREMTARIFEYFDEMNIPRGLPELMLSISPEEVLMLTFVDLVKFGLTGKDPVEAEMDDSAGAKRYGISRVEYLSRRKRALITCDPFLGLPNRSFVNCYEAVLKGRR